jgi:hypothetical protein
MITPLEYIEKYVNVKIAPSKIHGVGIFALRNIEVGEPLFVEWQGESMEYFLNHNDFSNLNKNVQNHLYDMFEFEKTNDEWKMKIILNKNCHWIFKTPLHWVNSCMQNETPNFDKESMLVTKPILSGEELFTKYGKYDKFIRTNII